LNASGSKLSESFALADGISHTEYRLFYEALPESLYDRVVSAENLASAGSKPPTLTKCSYSGKSGTSHTKSSPRVAQTVSSSPAGRRRRTEWWYRGRTRELGRTTWFHPSVELGRLDQPREDMKTSIATRFEE
jgi:hypothetical protein